MVNALLGYGIGILSLINAGNSPEPVLYGINVAIAVLFIISGSYSGWRAARGDEN